MCLPYTASDAYTNLPEGTAKEAPEKDILDPAMTLSGY
jgi:hypothetical protein